MGLYQYECWLMMQGGTNDDGEEGIFESLMGHLSLTIDAGEPTAVTRMRVIPSDDVLESSDLRREGD